MASHPLTGIVLLTIALRQYDAQKGLGSVYHEYQNMYDIKRITAIYVFPTCKHERA